MIDVKKLSVVAGGTEILKNIAFNVPTGVFYGIIGPNGSGKSTLLRAISGLAPEMKGTVRVEDKPVHSYSRKKRAQLVAVLAQEGLEPVEFTVREVLEMSRFPYQNWLGREKGDSSRVIEAVMEKLSLAHLADRGIASLSGGERQRVALGRAMVQSPRLLLLDEPTTFLDIGHQVQMMDYVRKWQRESNLTAVAVLHDLNLAAQYCDRILVLHEGKVVHIGTPEETMREELIERVYGTRPTILPHPETGSPQLLLRPGHAGQQAGKADAFREGLQQAEDLESRQNYEKMSSDLAVGAGKVRP
ncbi:ABC transporter ATP-binding protein [Gorillibacterium massiliense]|uniref:ABC transporter ATP-binding protein n=1 Tax=Gorillibacterium massiliense TaxID=1280390 RepID=UPI0004B786DA|nr:ABC transporter ATP-binding protein [Gorillibacterium massiliense]